MIINARLSIGYPTATRKEQIELPDDCTEDEIESTVREWAEDFVEISWNKG